MIKPLILALVFAHASIALGQVPPGVTPQPAPATAQNLSGGPFYYQVTGANGFGTIYGTGFYSIDSPIVKTVVHSGALAVGETGIIKLTLLGVQGPFLATAQNGISSSGFNGNFQAYEVERIPEPDFTITSQPQGAVRDAGDSATLTVGVSGSGQTFQWYRGQPGDLTQPIPAATTASLTVVAADPPSTYWVAVTNSSGSISSNGALVAAWVTGTVEGWQDFTVNLQGEPSTGDQASLLYAGNELYVLGQTGVFRSANNGNNFSTINTVTGTSAYDLGVSQLRFVKKANTFIYVGDTRNPASNTNNYTPLHRLTAGETSWTQASQVNLPDTVFTDSVEDVAYDAASGVYYAASNFAGCYYSVDGLTWEERRAGLPTQGTAASGQFVNATSVLVRNGKVFLTVQHPSLGGVFTSLDQGQSWTKTSVPNGGLPRLFEQDGRVFAVTSGVNTVSDGTYVSDDNGVTWERRPFLNLLSQIRGNGSLLVATPGTFGSQDLRFSTTRGDTWDEIDRTGLPLNYIWRAIEPSATDLYLIGYELGAGNIPQNTKVFRRPISQLNLTPKAQFILPAATVSAGFQRNNGMAFTLSIGEAPAGTVSYVWRKDGIVLTNQTLATLSIPAVSDADAGLYTAEIIGAGGSTGVTPGARLTIVPSGPGNGDTSFPQAESTRSGSLVLYNDFRLLHADGNYMALYDADGKFVTSRTNAADGRLRRGFMDSRGNLMLFGEFTLTRINPDTLADDASFAPVVFTGTTNTIRLHDVIELPGRGYLLAVETGMVLNGVAIPRTALFDYSGNFVSSATFAGVGRRLALAPDGKIYVGQTGIQRMLSNGVLDTSFSVGAGGSTYVVRPDGTIIYAAGGSASPLRKLNLDGSIDNDFTSRIPPLNNGSVTGLVIEPSGKILVHGSFQTTNGVRAAGHYRLNADGSPDATYNALPGYDFFGIPNQIGHVTYDPRGSFYFLPTTSGLTFTQTGRKGLAKVFADRPGLNLYRQPIRQSVAAGGSVTLNAGVTGTSTISYQWFRNGVIINGANSAALTLSGFGTAQAGRYSFTATNASGSVTSRQAVVDLIGAPNVVSLSGAVSTTEGTPLNLSVIANGDPTLTYQWTKNGSPIPLATDATFSLPTTTVSDSGDYRVVITNDVDSFTSDPLSVTFVPITGRIFAGTTPTAPSSVLSSIVIFPDGSYLVGGATSGSTNAPSAFRHFSESGDMINDSWADPGKPYADGSIAKLELNRAKDRVYVVVKRRTSNSSFLLRYHLDGTQDTTFSASRAGSVFAELSDGEILLADSSFGLNLSLLSNTGEFIKTVTLATTNTTLVRSMVALPDDSVLLAGRLRYARPDAVTKEVAVLKILPDGTEDMNFPEVLTGFLGMEMEKQSSGEIVLRTSALTLHRMSADGVLDTTFTASGLPSGDVTDIEIQPNDEIVVCGSTATVRLSKDGVPDPTFLPLTDFTGIFTATRALSNGRLYVIGNLTRRVSSVPVTSAILTTTTTQPSGDAAITAFYTSVGIPPAEQIDGADFDKDGVPNLLEYLYGTSPGAAGAAPRFSQNETNLTGASINSITAAGLDPAKTYYVVEIRLPKDNKGLSIALASTINFPTYDGSGSMNPYGPITDDGDFTVQSYYALPAIQNAAKAFWRLEATR